MRCAADFRPWKLNLAPAAICPLPPASTMIRGMVRLQLIRVRGCDCADRL